MWKCNFIATNSLGEEMFAAYWSKYYFRATKKSGQNESFPLATDDPKRCQWHPAGSEQQYRRNVRICMSHRHGRDYLGRKHLYRRWYNSLMFIPCISNVLEEKTNNMHWLYLPLFVSTCWLLHVSAVACHHQGAYWILLSYLKIQTEGWYII
jgi:hypothetical protein